MMLALGLNVVVGWGGLLDLGYLMFYGFGALTYANLRSDQFDLHWPTLLVIAIAIVGGALLGILVGLPSKRLSGDYLAIVTLFAYQIFISILIGGDNIFGTDLTGGVNGILKVDPLSFFGHVIPVSKDGGVFNVAYLYIALAFFTVLFVALRFVDRSRTGRAWRSLREDSLAAQLMGMPVPWLKLMAFSFGAAIASLTGTLFVALNGAVFPGQLRPHAADHDLRDDDPRRPRQPGRRRARRDPDQRPARAAAGAVELALHLLRRAPARPRRGAPVLGPPRRRRRRCHRPRHRDPRSSSTRSTRAGRVRRPTAPAGSAT